MTRPQAIRAAVPLTTIEKENHDAVETGSADDGSEDSQDCDDVSANGEEMGNYVDIDCDDVDDKDSDKAHLKQENEELLNALATYQESEEGMKQQIQQLNIDNMELPEQLLELRRLG